MSKKEDGFPNVRSGDPYRDAYEQYGAKAKTYKNGVSAGTLVMAAFLALIIGVLLCCVFFSRSLNNMFYGQQEESDLNLGSPTPDLIETSPTPQQTSKIMIYDVTPEPTPRIVPSLGGSKTPGAEFFNIFADIADEVRPSVVGIYVLGLKGEAGEGAGAGSGIILSQDGYIVTNNHVIADGNEIFVVMESGEEIQAEVIGKDALDDLAVIKIDRTGLKPIAIGDSSTVRVGEMAIAIGNPLGNLGGTVTQGIISAIDRPVFVESDNITRKLLQTDAAINPGNSGGALVNSQGRLVGINTLKTMYASTDPFAAPIMVEGIGFAIPINDAMPVISELIRNGYVSRPGIGVTASTVDEVMAQKNNMPQGVLILSITSGGAAEKAGILVGDIVIDIDNHQTLLLDDLLSYLHSRKVGDKVVITVVRGKEEKMIDVVLEDMNEMVERAKQ